jgi:hypothetical protein
VASSARCHGHVILSGARRVLLGPAHCQPEAVASCTIAGRQQRSSLPAHPPALSGSIRRLPAQRPTAESRRARTSLCVGSLPAVPLVPPYCSSRSVQTCPSPAAQSRNPMPPWPARRPAQPASPRQPPIKPVPGASRPARPSRRSVLNARTMTHAVARPLRRAIRVARGLPAVGDPPAVREERLRRPLPLRLRPPRPAPSMRRLHVPRHSLSPRPGKCARQLGYGRRGLVVGQRSFGMRSFGPLACPQRNSLRVSTAQLSTRVHSAMATTLGGVRRRVMQPRESCTTLEFVG